MIRAEELRRDVAADRREPQGTEEMALADLPVELDLDDVEIDYEALYGTGAAVVGLTPSPGGVGEKEFDEADVEHHHGDRNVIA